MKVAAFPCFLLALVAAPVGSVAQRAPAASGPLTRAEATGFRETSRYADVLAFLSQLDSIAPGLHRTTFGYTFEGRALPLVVWGAPEATAAAARATGKTRVLVMANIHAGEVEGKEALLVLLREIAAGRNAAWADSLVLLVAPIYNADGNEQVALDNRPLQLGPVGGMGQRPNAQGYDLNRDYMKLESPESRSLVALFTEWDPHVVIDLHTTDGTFHGYHLTYSPPLSPGTDRGIVGFLRDSWLPAVTRALAREPVRRVPAGAGPLERLTSARPWDTWHYGNLPRDEGFEAEPGWYTFSPQPRFGNNYEGLRNRFGILSEAYAYLPFEERIAVTERFVEELLDFAAGHSSGIRDRTAAADAATLAGQELPVRADFDCGPEVEILMGEVARERNPYTGAPVLRRLPVQRPERMADCTSFRGVESSRVPAAWLVPADLDAVIERLAAHGVRFYALDRPSEMDVGWFAITASRAAEREFQKHHARTLEGRWESGRRTVPSGTVVVPTAQPLGRLAFYLLDPRSDDGLVAWNVLDSALVGPDSTRPAERYPVLRASVAPSPADPAAIWRAVLEEVRRSRDPAGPYVLDAPDATGADGTLWEWSAGRADSLVGRLRAGGMEIRRSSEGTAGARLLAPSLPRAVAADRVVVLLESGPAGATGGEAAPRRETFELERRDGVWRVVDRR